MKNDLLEPMRRYGVIDVIGAENMYATLPTAVAAFRAWAERQPTRPRARRPAARNGSKRHRFARSDNPRRPQPKPPA